MFEIAEITLIYCDLGQRVKKKIELLPKRDFTSFTTTMDQCQNHLQNIAAFVILLPSVGNKTVLSRVSVLQPLRSSDICRLTSQREAELIGWIVNVYTFFFSLKKKLFRKRENTTSRQIKPLASCIQGHGQQILFQQAMIYLFCFPSFASWNKIER